MLIDALTVAAQIVNFLILVWLLRKFLYGRILNAIDARERAIAASLAEAETREKAAAQQLAAYQDRLAVLEQQQAALLAQARQDAEKQHAELLDKAREDVRALDARWRAELDRERATLLAGFRHRVATEVVDLTRRALADLASLDVQSCAVRAFLQRLDALPPEAHTALAQGDLYVRSAFDLPEDDRLRIRHALEDHLHAPVRLVFERASGLGLGLEVRGNGWRVGWNSESYLESLEADLLAALEPQAKAGAA